MGYVDSLKSKVQNEVCFTSEFKTEFAAKCDEINQDDPVTFLRTLGAYLNGLVLGPLGDRTLYRAKGLIGFLYGTSNLFEQLTSAKEYSAGERGYLIDGLIQQKGVPGGDGKWAF